MSNFNLVSDQNNGYRYTSYFGEEIVVPAGSKCYLNFASLFRDGGVNLTQDETVNIVSDPYIIPEKVVDSLNQVVANEVNGQFVIPGGKYTYAELQTKFNEEFEKIRVTAGNPTGPLYYSNSTFGGVQADDSTLEIGARLDSIIWNNGTATKDPVPKTVVPGTEFNNTSGANGSYKKTANLNTERDGTVLECNSVADNFCLSNTSLFHRTFLATPDNSSLCSKIKTQFNNNGQQSSIFFGLYGDEFGKLPNPVASNDTVGNNYPKLVSVERNPQYFDNDVIAPGDTDMTRWRGGANSLRSAGGVTTEAWEGFGMTMSSATSTADASFYPILDDTPFAYGVLNYEGLVLLSITGLAANTQFTLTQSFSSGGGTGIEVRATSNAAGEIGKTEIDAGKIIVPGDGFGAYDLSDTIDLEETTSPGALGTVTIIVTAISKLSLITGGYLREPEVKSPKDPTPVVTFSLGSGFRPSQNATINQLDGSITPTGYTIASNDIQATVMVPTAFLMVEVEGANEKSFFPHTGAQKSVNIYMAANNAGDVIGKNDVANDDWESQDVGITEMKRIATRSISSLDIYGSLTLQTYVSSVEPADYDGDPGIYFRLYDDNKEDRFTPIYDSYDDGYFFPHEFFTGIAFGTPAVTNLTDPEVQSSQYPLKIMQSTRHLGDEIVSCKYPQFNPDVAGPQSQIIDSMLGSLTWEFSDTLAKLLKIDGDTVTVYPYGSQYNPLTYYDSEIVLTWRNSSYYIEIEELPINNWKNTRYDNETGSGRQRKGNKKNILASIPLPFSGTLVDVVSTSTLLVGGTYDPPKMVVSDLLNQSLSTNRMSVRIYRMEDDKEATEITQSVVNFTIFKN